MARVTLQVSWGKFYSGKLEIALLMKSMPANAGRFLELAKAGFYKGKRFYRVGKDFMIQGGSESPEPGYSPVKAERPSPKNYLGTVAMATLGGKPDSGTTEFFINVVYNQHLDGQHSVFGALLDETDLGFAISLSEVEVRDKAGLDWHPVEDITITGVSVSEGNDEADEKAALEKIAERESVWSKRRTQSRFKPTYSYAYAPKKAYLPGEYSLRRTEYNPDGTRKDLEKEGNEKGDKEETEKKKSGLAGLLFGGFKF